MLIPFLLDIAGSVFLCIEHRFIDGDTEYYMVHGGGYVCV